jgi:hypothetical protein
MGKWTRLLVRSVLVLAFLLANLYLWDWVLLRVRISRGSGYGSVQVDQFLATPLKGNKVEYDFMGTAQVMCSRSLFPQEGHQACWWLERHPTQWE